MLFFSMTLWNAAPEGNQLGRSENNSKVKMGQQQVRINNTRL